MAVNALVVEELLFDDTENVFPLLLAQPPMPSICCAMASARFDRSKVSGFVEETVPQYHLNDFKTFFRLSSQTVEKLCEVLCNKLVYMTQGGRPPLPPEKQVLISLWYFGSQSTIHDIADRFGVTDFSVLRSRNKVCEAILSVREKFIQRPRQHQLIDLAQNFENKKGFPKTIGAIDGTHIRISKPNDHGDQYINRKGFASLQLQAVCDGDMKFWDTYVGWPGSVHDARILRNSDLWEKGLAICGNGEYHVIGDSAYPLRRWLITPFKRVGVLSSRQVKFNRCLSSTRVTIERAFGLLKGRFRRLQFLNVVKISAACKIITACCVLQNICLDQDDILDEVFEDDDEDDVPLPLGLVEGNAEGKLKRALLAHQLFPNDI